MWKLWRANIRVMAILAFCVFICASVQARPVTVFIPSQPSIENSPVKNGKDSNPAPEVDILMTLMRPFENAGESMDMPRLLASLRYPAAKSGENAEPERKDLLGDVEEIRYLDQKAWGANVGLDKAGLYQFIMEARPWWDEGGNKYFEEMAKIILPVLGVDNGWDSPAGMSFEIIPLTRPFGLSAPAIFSGKVMYGDHPLANAPVYMGRINTDKTPAPTNWHKTLEARTDGNGQFSFVLNRPGWWYCEAATRAAPLIGPDGEPKEVERATMLWLYVDDQPRKGK